MSESTETPKKKPTRASSAKAAASGSANPGKSAAASKASAGKAPKVSAAKSEPVAPVAAPPASAAAAPPSASAGKGAKARAQIADADAAEKKTPRRAAGGRPKSAGTTAGLPNQDIIDKMVAEAAYYLAEKRNFAVGFEEQDWLAAKEQIMTQLLGAKKPKV